MQYMEVGHVTSKPAQLPIVCYACAHLSGYVALEGGYVVLDASD